MATLNELTKRGQAYRAQKRQELDAISRVGQSGTAGLFQPGWGPGGMRTGTLSEQMGGLPIPYGMRGDERLLDRFIESGGGNPYLNAYQSGMAQRFDVPQLPAGAQPNGGSQQPAPMDDLLLQYSTALQAERDKANAANLARYNEALGLQTDLGQRNQERVANWGTAASADIDDRLQEQLGDNMAFLASRGLSNSTIAPAFAARAAKDTAREQQRVSEMRDSRLSEYDTRDTGNRIGIIERREDVAPSLESMARLALEYGRSGDGEGMQALQGEVNGLREQLAQRYQPQVAYQGGGGFSPNAAQQFQNAMNGAFGGADVRTFPMGNTSNAYPFNRQQETGQRAAPKKNRRSKPQGNQIISQPKYKVPLGFQAPQYA
jgi:hypothetical protein